MINYKFNTRRIFWCSFLLFGILNFEPGIFISPLGGKSGAAQGTWSQKQSVPAAGREGSAGFSIGRKGYMGTGLNMGFYKDFWEWDKASNTWSQKASIPSIERAEGIGFSIGTKGYLGMGWNTAGAGGADTMYNDLYEWDQGSNTWSTKTPFPGSYGRAGASAFAIGAKAYIGLGADTITTYDDWWEWDQGSNSWTQKGDFPGGIRWFACTFVMNNKGYLGTGSAFTSKKDFWEYNPTTDSWTQKATFPGAGRFQAAAFSICNYGYIGIGTTDIFMMNMLKDFYQWDPVSDSWIQVADFGGPARREVTSFSISDTGYVVCGGGAATFPITNYSDMWEFTSPFAPIAGFIALTPPICESQCLNFTDTSTGNITYWNWTFQGGNPSTSTAQNPSNICYANSGLFDVQLIIIDTSRCAGPDTAELQVQVDTFPVADAGPGSAICLGSSAVLTGSGGTTYSWSPTTNLSCATCATTSASPAITTTYTLTATNTCGSDQDTVTVTVSGTGGPSLSTSSVSAGCGTCNGQATVSVSGGTPPYTYDWSSGSTASNAIGLCSGTYSVTVNSAPGADIIFWNEDFSSGGTGWTLNTNGPGTNGTLPNEWIVNSAAGCPCGTGNYMHITCNTGSFNCFGINPDCGYTDGPQMFYDNRTDRLAISQDISTIGRTNMTLRFDWIADGEPGNDYCKVRLSNDGGGSWTELPTEYSSQTTCQQATVSIPAAYENVTNFKMAFRWVNDADGNYNDPPFGVDNIELSVPGTGGCASFATVTVNQNTTLSISTSTTPATCSANDGTATASPSSGTPPYTYTWSSGQTIFNITGLPAGTYTITVSDAGGCTASSPVTVNSSGGFSVTLSPVSALCNGSSDGIASVSTAGGSAPFTYIWSNSQTGSIATGLAAGAYSVTVTDASGCTTTGNTTVTQPAAVSVSVTKTDATCGNSDGSTTASATGGSGGFSYSWSTGGTGTTVNNLGIGTYTVTATDVNGCTGTQTATINSAGGATVSVSSIINVSCNGGNDGAVTVIATGGTPPYTYLWSNSGSQSSVIALTSGAYTVTVTDGSGCATIDSAAVTEPTAITISINKTNATCGNNDGSATAAAAGGSGSYSYLWSNTATSSIANALGGGDYTVTVTDGNGCTQMQMVTILSIGGPAIIPSTIQNITCYGSNDGVASVSATGGTPPYTYLWSNASTSSTLIGISAGTYTVTVTDLNNCATVDSTVVTEPSAILLTTGKVDASCGGSDGSASAAASGGIPPYAYLWNNGGTNDTISGITSGNYTVTVTDINNCTETDIVGVNEAGAATVTIASQNNVSCSGGSNGSVSLSVTGGTPPYTYLWSTGSSQSSLTGLQAGNYLVTVTDNAGCNGYTNTTITEPPALTTVMSSTDETCTAYGTATVTTAGGNGSYSYLWSNAATSATPSGLNAGTYIVTVTDANGCTMTDSVTVSKTGSVTASVTGINEVCAGETATLIATGGTSYWWNNSVTNDTLNIIPAATGTYFVIATQGSCKDTAWYTVIVNPAVQVDAGKDTAIYIGESATLNSTVTGGTSPFTHSWSTGAGTGSITVTPSVSTEYFVTVVDAKGCTSKDSVFVDVLPCDAEVFVPNAFAPDCKCPDDKFRVYSDCIEKLELRIFDRWGEKIFEIPATNYRSLTTGSWWNGNFKSKPMDAAVYVYILKYTTINKPDEEVIMEGNLNLLR